VLFAARLLLCLGPIYPHAVRRGPQVPVSRGRLVARA